MIRTISPAAIWAILVVVTLLSYLSWLNSGWDNRQSVGSIVLIIAFFKARIIGLHFMELAAAPWPLRLLFEAWVVLACTAFLVLFWIG